MSLFHKPNSPYWYTEIQVAGMRVVRSTRAIQRREAERFQRQLRAELRAQANTTPRTALTLDQACGRYWLEHGQTLRWAKDVEWHLKRIITMLGTTLLLSELGNAEVNDLVQARRQDGAGAAGVNRTLAVLRQVCRRAAKKWDEPIRLIDWAGHWMAEPKERVRWISRDEAVRLLGVLPGHVRDAVEWSLLTGCRRSETFALRWSDIDLERGAASIAGKTGPRTIWLSATVLLLLARLSRDGELVFDATNRRKLFEAGVKAAGLVDFRWHDLRHTHATWMRQSGVALEVVQRSLGHASVTTTARYAHVDDREVRAALAALPVLSPAPDNVVTLTPTTKPHHSN